MYMDENKKSIQGAINLNPSHNNFEVEDYFVSQCNEAAYEAAHSSALGFAPFPTILIIKGNNTSGKSFLGYVASKNKDGIIIKSAEDLIEKSSKLYIIDDADHWAEEDVFHAINIAFETGKNLIIFAGIDWAVNLPDLASRVQSIKTEKILEPDDQLIEIIIASEFSKRSLDVGRDVITYLKTRLPRNFGEIINTIDSIDKFCLENKRNVTVKAIHDFIQES